MAKQTPEKKYNNWYQDGRRKIDPRLHKEIIETYHELQSYQKTADHYNISKRQVIFIVKPETLQTLQTNNKRNQHWKRYYDKDKRKLYMRRYRAKKRQLGFIHTP